MLCLLLLIELFSIYFIISDFEYLGVPIASTNSFKQQTDLLLTLILCSCSCLIVYYQTSIIRQCVAFDLRQQESFDTEPLKLSNQLNLRKQRCNRAQMCLESLKHVLRTGLEVCPGTVWQFTDLLFSLALLHLSSK